MGSSEYKIPIEGKTIIGKPERIDIRCIEFDEFNPRISMARDSEIMGSGKKRFNQELLAYFLKAQPGYSELKNSIRHSGGATIPIWIYPITAEKYGVIEGNTRLLIHRELAEEEGDKYGIINCIVLPKNINEDVKDYLRLICHLRGHTDWDKYEQAKYLHSLFHKEKYPIKDLAKITKLSAAEIMEDIRAYEIMDNQFKKKYGETEIVHRFSYFKEFVKNKKLINTMTEQKLGVDNFCDWVGLKKIDRAMDVRKLDAVLKESIAREIFFKKDLDRALEILKDIVPERSEKIYIMMADLTKKIDAIEYADILEIESKESKKRKVVTELFLKLQKLLKVENVVKGS